MIENDGLFRSVQQGNQGMIIQSLINKHFLPSHSTFLFLGPYPALGSSYLSLSPLYIYVYLYSIFV